MTSVGETEESLTRIPWPAARPCLGFCAQDQAMSATGEYQATHSVLMALAPAGPTRSKHPSLLNLNTMRVNSCATLPKKSSKLTTQIQLTQTTHIKGKDNDAPPLTLGPTFTSWCNSGRLCPDSVAAVRSALILCGLLVLGIAYPILDAPGVVVLLS